jgi:hypothetical protein
MRLQLDSSVERIEDLWRSAMELVRDLIGRDLPEEILQVCRQCTEI